jgi:hypothetical protein
MDFKSQIGANPPRTFLRDILHFSDGEIAMTKKDTVNTLEAHFHSFSTKRGSVCIIQELLTATKATFKHIKVKRGLSMTKQCRLWLFEAPNLSREGARTDRQGSVSHSFHHGCSRGTKICGGKIPCKILRETRYVDVIARQK